MFCHMITTRLALTLSLAECSLTFHQSVGKERDGPGIFRQKTDSSDKGAKIQLPGYYKCQKSPKNSFHPPTGG